MRLASWERRKPDERLSPAAVSGSLSFSRMVKNTFACDRSGETSTEVIVTIPTRGSRSSRWIRSESSRWIWSPSFWGRPDDFFSIALEGAGHFHNLKDLELVVF